MPEQQGVMSAYQLMAHNHSGVGQGGLVSHLVLNNVPQVDVRRYATFADAIAGIGATETLLLISIECAVAGNITVPANITLKFEQGGFLNIANGVIVTLDNPPIAGLYQIFAWTGTGRVFFTDTITIYPEWWGAIGDQAIDDTLAFQAAVDVSSHAVPSKTPYVNLFLTGKYRITDTLSIQDGKLLNMQGTGAGSFIWLDIDTSTDGILFGFNTYNTAGVRWRDFGIYGGVGSCRFGLILDHVHYSTFDNIYLMMGTNTTGAFPTPGGAGIRMNDVYCNLFKFKIPVILPHDYGQAIPTNAIHVATVGHGATVCNANRFDLLLAGCPMTGLYIYTSAEYGNNYISGTYQNIVGYSIYVRGGMGVHLFDIHNEPTGRNENLIAFDAHTFGRIGANVNSFPHNGAPAYNDVDLISCTRTIIDGLFCGRLHMDVGCVETQIKAIRHSTFGVSPGIFDDSATTMNRENTVHLESPTELTIAGGVITRTKGYHTVDGQGDAADTLLTINGGVDGMELTLQAENVGRPITVQEGGNIQLEGGVACVLAPTLQKLYLFYDGISTSWVEKSRFTG